MIRFSSQCGSCSPPQPQEQWELWESHKPAYSVLSRSWITNNHSRLPMPSSVREWVCQFCSRFLSVSLSFFSEIYGNMIQEIWLKSRFVQWKDPCLCDSWKFAPSVLVYGKSKWVFLVSATVWLKVNMTKLVLLILPGPISASRSPAFHLFDNIGTCVW